MLTYWVIKNYIKDIENKLDNDPAEALDNLLTLKKEITSYLADIVKVLEWLGNNMIPKELYNLIFQNIQEIALDLDNFYLAGKTFKDNKEIFIESKINEICKKLNADSVKIFFEKFSEIMSDIMLFLEHKKEKSIPAPDLKHIKKAIERIKN
jgi:hypothetical protein